MKEQLQQIFSTDPEIKAFAMGVLSFIADNDILSDTDFEHLCDSKFCRENLKTDYPVLLKVDEKGIHKPAGHQRYYFNDIREIKGVRCAIQSQWYRSVSNNPKKPENRLPLYRYLLEKIGLPQRQIEDEMNRVKEIVEQGRNMALGRTGEDPRYGTWSEFLQKWPAERLPRLTLDEYSTFGPPNQSFCNWLESWTQTLGSIWGGSSYKFGVFRMQPGSEVVTDSTHDGDGTYKWYKCYGRTAGEAFDRVRSTICEVVENIQSGSLEKLDGLRFGDAVTWKIAFLYQSRTNPLIVPIYKRSWLCELTGMPSRTPVSVMQRKLLSEKPAEQDLLAYYDELLARLPGRKDEGIDDTDGGNAGRDMDIAQIEDLSVDELATFMEQLAKAGLLYDEVFVRRFFAALQAKNFVILTGLSGSGKTQLAIQFCEFIAKRRNTIVSVGADWTNNEKMLGYPDAVNCGKYVRPESGVLDLVLQASRDPDRPYVLVLDEMNLSHVERYFADFLSAMESKGELRLHGGPGTLEGVPPTVRMPSNLWVIGTMNVDETTYMFSPKVLDRAQVLEFRVKAADMKSFLAERQAAAAEALNGFFPELAKVGAEFGYRTAGEFCSYVEKAIALGSVPEEAVDAAVMQKLLPKLHGSRRQLERPLEALWKLCLKPDVAASVETLAKAEGEIDDFPYPNNCRYPISGEKIARIYKNAKNNGFASYAEA